MANARAWALRNQLELQKHDKAVWTTLTYDKSTLPPTLDRRHLQLYIKRLRYELGTARPLRFFACGEYGEQNGRPHFHAILYGLGLEDRSLVEDAWGMGRVRTYAANPANIAYTAGYSSKKVGWVKAEIHDRVDPDTGEVYRWQPPFLQMSRRPGIGAHARQWTQSWRLYAVMNGTRMPVPRYLHEAWKATATNEQLEDLIYEKYQIQQRREPTTEQKMKAAEQIAIANHRLQGEKRKI